MKPIISRRNLLKSILSGGGVAATKHIPSIWTKPFVCVVVLPAHAQTSATLSNTPFEFRLAWVGPTRSQVEDIINASWTIENTGDALFEISVVDFSLERPQGSIMFVSLDKSIGEIVHPGETISAIDIQGQFDVPGDYVFIIGLYIVANSDLFGPFFDRISIPVGLYLN